MATRADRPRRGGAKRKRLSASTRRPSGRPEAWSRPPDALPLPGEGIARERGARRLLARWRPGGSRPNPARRWLRALPTQECRRDGDEELARALLGQAQPRGRLRDPQCPYLAGRNLRARRDLSQRRL